MNTQTASQPRLRRGHSLAWRGISITVTRAARDGSWADFRCTAANGNQWVKRQLTLNGELPPGFTLVATPEERLLLAIFNQDPGSMENVRLLRLHAQDCTEADHALCFPAKQDPS